MTPTTSRRLRPYRGLSCKTEGVGATHSEKKKGHGDNVPETVPLHAPVVADGATG